MLYFELALIWTDVEFKIPLPDLPSNWKHRPALGPGITSVFTRNLMQHSSRLSPETAGEPGQGGKTGLEPNDCYNQKTCLHSPGLGIKRKCCHNTK